MDFKSLWDQMVISRYDNRSDKKNHTSELNALHVALHSFVSLTLSISSAIFEGTIRLICINTRQNVYLVHTGRNYIWFLQLKIGSDVPLLRCKRALSKLNFTVRTGSELL